MRIKKIKILKQKFVLNKNYKIKKLMNLRNHGGNILYLNIILMTQFF